MSRLNRRKFVRAAALAATAATAPLAGNVLGANERIAVGLIGAGGMGRANLTDFLKNPDVEVAAICDVNQLNLEKALGMVGGTGATGATGGTGGRPAAYRDFRQLLERKDIDAVIVATPDHWHALQAIYACQAGKDVYVEKPLALSIVEQQKMVKAARDANRVVQVGTQQRSGKHFQRAVELLRSGKLGNVSFVRTWNHENGYPTGIGNPPDSDPPATLDWDFWLGPAPRVPYNRNRAAPTFRWFWDYSGGKLTDWGTHLIDIVHWAMEVDGPTAASASGGKFFLQDNRETPDTLEVLYEYPGFVMVYSSRECNARGVEGKGYGMEFHGTLGTMLLDRSGFEIFPEFRRDGDEYLPRTAAMRVGGSDQHPPHVRNFLDCVKSRNRPISDIETGHRSTTASHLGNIAFRTGQKIHWDPAGERLLRATPEATALLSREYRRPWSLP